MKAFFSTFALSFILIAGFAEASTDSQTVDLDNTSLKSTVELSQIPEGRLVYLNQIEGIDPFGLFEEGLDPENENPLRVAKEDGKLEVSVAGSSYTDGFEDDYNQEKVVPLAFNAFEQRYLVTNTYQKRDNYQLIINIDRKAKSAKVYMRQFDQKWSSWELTATYGK